LGWIGQATFQPDLKHQKIRKVNKANDLT